MHIRIISYIGIEPFLLVINLDVVSSSNVFSSLIFMSYVKVLTF